MPTIIELEGVAFRPFRGADDYPHFARHGVHVAHHS